MFEPRVALASLSGESDAEWAVAGSEWAGAAFLGGLALDERTRDAARRMVEGRDRSEFLPENPHEFMAEQLEALEPVDLRPGFNVRAVDLDALERAARICADYGAILEINAHCRQPEMTALGAGQALLNDPQTLVEGVETAVSAGATVSVKGRTEIPGVDLPALGERLEDAGAEVFHVDAMDSESVIGEIDDRTALFLIANNEVRDRESVEEYLGYGADAVSVGRPSSDPGVLERVQRAVRNWFDDRPGAN